MIQDMMFGTIEKNRVREIQDDDSFWEAQLKKKTKKGETVAEDEKPTAKPKNLKTRLIEEFLKSKLGQEKVEKVEVEERDLKQNPMKYNIIEEQLITESEGLSTARKALSSVRNRDENIDGKDTNSMNNEDLPISDKQIMMSPDEEENEGGEGVEEVEPADDKQNVIDAPEQPNIGNDEDKETQNKDLILDEDDKPIEDLSEIKVANPDGKPNSQGLKDELNNISKPKKISAEKADSYSNLLGYNTSKLRPKASLYDDYCAEEDYYPSVLNETIELNLLLLEKIFNTFKRKADKIVSNFRKNNYAHLRPKILHVIEKPPDDFWEKLKHGLEEMNDQTVLIDKDNKIEQTFDKDRDLADESEFHVSDKQFDEINRQQIDRAGMMVGSNQDKDKLLAEEDEERRKQLLSGMLFYENGSVHSHDTSTILDADAIAFQDPVDAMVNNAGSDYSMDEQDIVYYHKDDTTQFSKPLGLNKTKKRDGNPLKLSEEDISDDTSNRSNLMPDPLFRTALSDIGDEPSALGDFDEPRSGDRPGLATGGGLAGLAGLGAVAAAKRKRKRKGKKAKLSDFQKRKLKKWEMIYGQDTSELGLAPRDQRYANEKGRRNKHGNKDGNRSLLVGPDTLGTGKKGKVKRKRKAGDKDGNESVDGARARFNALRLDKPNRPEGEYDKLKRKLQKFRKRKDLSFWMDYESPYAEYLPHRFREWVPKTKLGVVLDTKKEEQNHNDKAVELSRIYSRGLSPGEERHDDFENPSKNEDKSNFKFYSASKASRSEFRPKTNSSMNAQIIHSGSSGNKLSSSKKKSGSSRNDRSSRPPPHMSTSNNLLQPDDVYLHKESHDALNEDTARSKNEMNIGPLFENELAAEEIDYSKANDDEEIDFKPVQFNQIFDE